MSEQPTLKNTGDIWIATRWQRVDGEVIPFSGLGKSAPKAIKDLEAVERRFADMKQNEKTNRPRGS